jgi:hypothetical protein
VINEAIVIIETYRIIGIVETQEKIEKIPLKIEIGLTIRRFA